MSTSAFIFLANADCYLGTKRSKLASDNEALFPLKMSFPTEYKRSAAVLDGIAVYTGIVSNEQIYQ